MEERAAEDQRNDRSRPHIGVGASEIVSSCCLRVYLADGCNLLALYIQFQDSETKRLIEKKEYDSPGRVTGRIGNAGGGQGVSMETLSRFSMIKSRIY